ncbi:aminodeoxychorismate lyase, partial [Erysipelothrix rhusiopathiae]|nr:aminodeoxychorismate lyase [Erysipelothrix rhusiopathiae]
KPAASESDVIVFLVTSDDTLDTIAERLEGQGIVRSKKFFNKTDSPEHKASYSFWSKSIG